MCYASNRDFGWRTRKEPAREPEASRTDEDIRAGSWTKADDSTVQAFLDRARAADEEPAGDRTV